MVTEEEIRHMAILSKLSVSDEELPALTQAMDEILAFADTIRAAGEPTADFDTVHGLQNVFREDTVVPSLPQEEILQNREGGEDGFFPVPRRA